MMTNIAELTPGVDPLGHMPMDYEPDADLFAGGGGASTGFEVAFGKSPDIAINHDPEALAMHRANHPATIHFCQNVINVEPLAATGGRLLRALWASPDCTHFSKAKGAVPRNQFIRDLAWTVTRWARHTRPKVIGIENVEEFKTWGPLDAKGYPIKDRAGETFRQWVRSLKRLGYSVSFRELRACDYGAPTTRKRLFVYCRLDKRRIRWPKPTHGPGRAKPWRTAAECINWLDPAPSIFDRKKPLALNTQRRIAEGIRRYVLESAKPFLVAYYGPKGPNDFRGYGVDEPMRTQTTENRFGLVSPLLVTPNHAGDHFRGQGVDAPLGTATAKGSFCLVTANLIAKHYGGVVGHGVDRPLGTITSIDHHSLITASIAKLRGTNIGTRADEPLQTISAQGTHHALVSASLIKYYSEGGQHADIADPMPTSTAKARFGLTAVHLQQYNGMSEAQPLSDPMPTVPTKDRFALTAASLCQFNGSSIGKDVSAPLPTVCSRDKFGLIQCMLQAMPESDLGNYLSVRDFLRTWNVIGPDDEAVVEIEGVVFFIIDIGLRMLRPRELFTANGFPGSYIIDPIYNGKPLTITSQVKKCGNSVPPQFVTALFRANMDALDYCRESANKKEFSMLECCLEEAV